MPRFNTILSSSTAGTARPTHLTFEPGLLGENRTLFLEGDVLSAFERDLLEDDDDGMAVFDKPDRVKISKNLSDILGETRLFRPNFKNKTLPWQAR